MNRVYQKLSRKIKTTLCQEKYRNPIYNYEWGQFRVMNIDLACRYVHHVIVCPLFLALSSCPYIITFYLCA